MEGMAAIHSKEMKEFSIYLLIVNIFTFIVYGVDKLKAKEHWWRISEATLLFLAVVGGSVGAWVGMKVWHHKTMHKKFKYGVPIILLLQAVLFCYIEYKCHYEEAEVQIKGLLPSLLQSLHRR